MIKTLTVAAVLAASLVTLNVGSAGAANFDVQNGCSLFGDRADHYGFKNYVNCADGR